MGNLNCLFHLDFMLYKLAAPKRLVIFLLALASLHAIVTPLQAEPVVHGPAQPVNRLIDASQWLHGTRNSSLNTSDPEANAVSPQSTPAAQPGLPRETASAIVPLTDTSEGSNSITTTLMDPVKPTNVTASKATSAAPDHEIRSAVKELVRPLYEDLSTSDAAQTLRGLQTEFNLDKDQAFSIHGAGQASRQDGTGLPPETATWEGQTNREPPRSAAQVEREKILASVMMDKLIDAVTPWAIGLVALYALFYVVKLGLAYGRHRSNRRRRSAVRVRRKTSS